jgi:SAM-dependent methyltransferase
MSSPGEPFVARLNRVAQGFQEAKIMMVGCELGLYDRLAEGPADAAELARALSVTVRGIEILADALVATGYLTKEGGRYANRPEVAELLVRGRPGSLAHMMAHRNLTLRNWALLEEVIRDGPRHHEEQKPTLCDPTANRNFILAMAEGSRERVGPLVERLPLAGAGRFVDLGGGPGHYACEAVRRHPDLRALLVDLPLTVEVAKEYVAAAGLGERVDTLVCDFFRADSLALGELADVVLVSQVLHAEGVAENQALLRKLAPCVRQGGWVAVSENLVDEGRTSPVAGALFAVNMLAGTERGRTYTAGEIAGWLDAAGFEPSPVELVAERTGLLLAQKR